MPTTLCDVPLKDNQTPGYHGPGDQDLVLVASTLSLVFLSSSSMLIDRSGSRFAIASKIIVLGGCQSLILKLILKSYDTYPFQSLHQVLKVFKNHLRTWICMFPAWLPAGCCIHEYSCSNGYKISKRG